MTEKNLTNEQLIIESLDVLRHVNTHFDLFAASDYSKLKELITRFQSHATELDRVRAENIKTAIRFARWVLKHDTSKNQSDSELFEEYTKTKEENEPI